MTVKEYLGQIRNLELKHRYRMLELKRLREDISPIRGMTYDSARVMTSPKKSTQTELMIDRIVDLESEIIMEAELLHEKRRKIVAQIEAIDDIRYRELLLLRYVDGYSLRAIGVKMGYSYDWAKKAHGQALKEFIIVHKMSAPLYTCISQ